MLAEIERREREAQRDAVARELPEPGEGSLLRLASGEVLVYDEDPAKRRHVNLRAAIMPDGDVLEFETERFSRN